MTKPRQSNIAVAYFVFVYVLAISIGTIIALLMPLIENDFEKVLPRFSTRPTKSSCREARTRLNAPLILATAAFNAICAVPALYALEDAWKGKIMTIKTKMLGTAFLAIVAEAFNASLLAYSIQWRTSCEAERDSYSRATMQRSLRSILEECDAATSSQWVSCAVFASVFLFLLIPSLTISVYKYWRDEKTESEQPDLPQPTPPNQNEDVLDWS